METTIYTVGGKTFELRHHGVKGMKWGRRKARPQATGTGRRGGQAPADSAQSEAARKQKMKRAAKIGAAVVGTALTAYGAKKIHDVVRDKNHKIRMEQGRKEIKRLISMTGLDETVADRWSNRDLLNGRAPSTFGDIMRDADRKARNDSFGTAARNVYRKRRGR